jgi:hypothetical protein
MTLAALCDAAAIAALNIYAIAELLCPHTDTTIDTAGRQLRSDIDFRIGASTCREPRSARRALSTDRRLDSEAVGLIGGSQHH